MHLMFILHLLCMPVCDFRTYSAEDRLVMKVYFPAMCLANI